MATKTIRVGFDLDGVILYNPIRIFRPIVAAIKPLFFRNPSKKNKFYFPQTLIEKFVWRLLHWTSFMINDGVKEIIELNRNHKIETYIITARYDFLKIDFDFWMNKLNAKENFKGYFYNCDNLQPNEFKEKMLNKLKLDYYVEDNWGVVQRLGEKVNGCKIIWLTNLLDNKLIKYEYKFLTLKNIVKYLKSISSKFSSDRI